MGQSLGHGSVGSTRVDSSQYIDKNGYYHNLKTLLRSQPEARFRSQVKRALTQLLFFKLTKQPCFDQKPFSKQSTGF